MMYGATPLLEGGVRFRVWAPKLKTLAVTISGSIFPMTRRGEDFEVHVAGASPGDRGAVEWRRLVEQRRILKRQWGVRSDACDDGAGVALRHRSEGHPHRRFHLPIRIEVFVSSCPRARSCPPDDLPATLVKWTLARWASTS